MRLFALWQAPRARYALLAGVAVALLLLLIWGGGFFVTVRLRLNDLYYAPLETRDQIVIVGIDDASLNRYGRTPGEWSRQVFADFADQMLGSGARVLAFDLLFSEQTANDDAFADALLRLRQSDARTRIVLGAAGVESTAILRPEGDFRALTFRADLPLSPVIAERADYRGYTNAIPDLDSVIRRQPSLLKIDERTRFGFSLAVYLAYLRLPESAAEQVISAEADALLLAGDRRVPVDDYGLWIPYYFGTTSDRNRPTFPVIPLTDVIDGTTDMRLFADKIVLVGLINSTGMLDQYQIPAPISGSLMAGVEIQANSVESLLAGMTPQLLDDRWQGVIIVVLALTASLIYAPLRWGYKVALACGLLLAWLGGTSVFFSVTQVKVSLFETLLALALPVLTSVGIDITLETRRRQQKEFLLSSLRRIAEQRLQLGQAGAYILEDVKKIAPPGVDAALYIRDSEIAGSFRRVGATSESGAVAITYQEDTIFKRYRDSSDPVVRDDRMTAIPLIWQGKRQGMITVNHPQYPQLGRDVEALLKDFATQLAPNVDNMLLYDELQKRKTLLDAVFAESPAGVALVDSGGTVLQGNQHLSQLLGVPMRILLGGNLPELVSQRASNIELGRQMRQGLAGDSAFSLGEETSLGDRFVRVDVAPLIAYRLWTVILVDVTGLVELSKLKTQMIRMASHDLKNPLTRVLGFAELIKLRAGLGEKDAQYMEFIFSAANDMLEIINGILDLERLRSGKLSLENTDLSQLIREVCSSHQPDVIQRHQSFELTLPHKPIHAKIDAGRISHAITNLVGNAIKYTPDDGNVSVRLMLVGDDIRFEVQDTGYGIPKQAQNKLFSEFYRVRSESTAHISGTGLGLSLVKSVINAHGGEIGFTSEVNVGSTFFFTIPASLRVDTPHA